MSLGTTLKKEILPDNLFNLCKAFLHKSNRCIITSDQTFKGWLVVMDTVQKPKIDCSGQLKDE